MSDRFETWAELEKNILSYSNGFNILQEFTKRGIKPNNTIQSCRSVLIMKVQGPYWVDTLNNGRIFAIYGEGFGLYECYSVAKEKYALLINNNNDNTIPKEPTRQAQGYKSTKDFKIPCGEIQIGSSSEIVGY